MRAHPWPPRSPLFGQGAEEELSLVNDSCIDWGALSPKEIAAAFVMLKGGRKEEANSKKHTVVRSA